MSKIPIVNLSIANTGYLKIGNAELNETELTRLLGLTGSSGSVGNGADGPTGPAGSDGINGADGAIGSTGPSGINGINGNDGAMGPTGPAGADSTVPGPIGPIGSTGPVGVGLRGPTGPYGGPMGPTGDKGDKGDQADIFDIVVYYDTVADLINDTTFWTVGKHALVALNNAGTASSIYINKGSAGGNIGHMSQWQFLLDVTPIVINGKDGATGPSGADGSDGNVGADGAIGPTGPVGPESTVAGPPGSPGQIGPTGEKGLDGVDGLKGATGPRGNQGVTGPPSELFIYKAYFSVSDPALLPDPNQHNLVIGDYVLYYGNENFQGAIYRYTGNGGVGFNSAYQFVSYVGQGTAGSQGPTGPNGTQGPTGFVDPNSDVNFNGNFTINNKTLYLNNSKLGINVANPTSSLEIDGNTSLKTLFVSNDASMNSKLHVSNDFDVATNKFTVESASGDTVIAGNTTLSKTLSVIGDTSISGNILPATNTINLGNASNKFANVYTKNLFVDQNTINFQTDAGADAGSIAMAGGKLQVTDENAQSIDTIGLTDDGAGNKYLHNLDISGDLTLIHGDVSFNNNLFVNGDTSFNGDVHIIGNLKADKFNQEFIINTETTNYTLIVAEDLSLNNRLFIEGDASFNEDIYVKGNVNFDGTINSVTTTEFGHLDSVTSNIQTQIDSKHPNINSSNRLSADLIHDGSVSNTKFGYLNGVTSDIQNQIDGKQPTIGNSTRLDAGLIHDGSVSNAEFGYLNNVTSNIQNQIDGKQDNLTFGIADTNAVQIDGSSAADDKYARFTSSGIEGRTTAELKSDIGLNNVTNESKSTMFSSPTFTGSISAPDNSIPAAAIIGDIGGGGASTITYMTTSIYNSSSTDHQDKLFAAYANIDSSGYKQYYMSKLQKIDNNDYEWYYTEINPMGSKSITIDDTWGPNAPSISYSGSPFTITDGDSVNITSSNSGGAATWSISPALTNGLSLDANNGNITGTASGTLTETDYTITATNSTGTNTATIKITIEAAVVAPSISYSGDPFTFTDGDSVNITSSNSGGAVTSWSINPAINNGLTFNTSTGNITGTASGTLGATGYTITATNSSDTSTVTITITIEAAAVSYPGISSVTYIPSDYSTNIANYNYGQTYVGLTTEGTIYFNIKLENPTNSQDTWYVIPMNLESDATNSTLTTLSYTNTNTTLHYLPSAYATNNNTTTTYNAGALFLANAANSTLYMYGKIPNTNWSPSYYSGGVDYNVQYGGNNKFVYRFVQNGTGGLSNLPGTMNTNYTYTANTGCIPPLPVNYNDASVKNSLNDGQIFIGRYGDGLYLIIFINNAYKQIGLNIVAGISYAGNAATYNSDTHWVYPPP
jgi:cytoskeletal protein CcmA (bactofilin family)